MLLRIYFSLCLINFINFNEAVNLRCPNSTCFCDENSVLQVVDEWDSSEVSDLPKLIVKCPHENRAEIEVQIVKTTTEITCYQHHENAYELLPKLPNYSLIHEIKLQDCPLIPHKRLTPIFGDVIDTATELTWKIKGKKDTLVREHFDGFKSLTKLNMTNENSLKISENVFDDLKNLQVLFLMGIFDNEITQLPNGIFNSLKKLDVLYLTKNHLKYLQPGGFKNQFSLLHLVLNDNKLQSLSKDSFEGLQNLEDLELRNNELTFLDSNVFEHLKSLKEINLDENKFTHISTGILRHNKNLSSFGLTQTKENLEFLPAGLLSNLSKLYRVSINCGLKELPHDLFAGSKMIIEIYLNGNQLQSLPEHIFRDQKALHYLSLINNRLQSLHENLFVENKNLTFIYLAHNQLKSFNCDCFQWLPNLKILSLKNNEIKAIDCKDPNPIENLPHHNFCHIEEKYYVKEDFVPFRSLFRLNLSSNAIAQFNHNLLKARVFNLNMTFESFVNCKAIDSSYVALDDLHSHHFEAKKEIVFLDMSKNNLESLDDETIGAIYGSSKLRNISFGKNPWKCDCNARKILDFVKVLSGNKIQDYEHIKCFSDGKLVSSIDIDKICSNFIWIVLGSTFAVLGLIVACTMTFFYTYSLEIKCWLYNHNFCLRFVTEEDLDEDKIYDAFISYAHQDEAFVENVLLTALETEPSPYKICIHVRDWIAGESIVEQAEKSVNESRRTIVVMSPHFMESVWGQQELMFAFQQAMEDKRVRVILIIKGDIEEIKKLAEGCPLILAYLKSHTYIEWNDRWFWNKLMYAMPHKGPRTKRETRKLLELEYVELDEISVTNN